MSNIATDGYGLQFAVRPNIPTNGYGQALALPTRFWETNPVGVQSAAIAMSKNPVATTRSPVGASGAPRGVTSASPGFSKASPVATPDTPEIASSGVSHNPDGVPSTADPVTGDRLEPDGPTWSE